MQIKKNVCMLLCIIMLMGMLTGCGRQVSINTEESASTEESTQPIIQETENTTVDYPTIIDSLSLDSGEKIELLIAYELGFPMENLTNSTITGAEYAVLLDRLVEYAAHEKLDNWKTHHIGLRSYESPLERSEAMAALYLAADFIGGYYDDFQMRNMEFHETVDHFWDVMIRGDLFDAEVMDHNNFYSGDFGNNSYLDGASMSFCAARISEISGNYLFSYDAETNSFNPSIAPTYAEALMSVIRLISSAEPDLWEYKPGDTDQLYLDMADVRRQEIANTVTDCTTNVTGTIYYISNKGDDSNDGKSPETAWATVDPVWSGVIQSGDAILFERGSVWYLSPQEGHHAGSAGINFDDLPGAPTNVTVGAYGEGEKPLLRGDISGASSPSFWTLYSDENGKKIWKSTVDLKYVPVIVFNEGETWADGILPWISPERTHFVHPDGEEFTVENGLTDDMTFVWLPELMENTVDILMQDGQCGSIVDSPVYLRCDAGNPAEVFSSVIIPQTSTAISLNNYCSAYDLDVRYFRGSGLSVTTLEGVCRGQTFVNLAVGWCGGNNGQYSEMCDDDCYGIVPTISGGGIHIQTNADITLTGCHIYQCGPMSTILSMHGYDGISAGDDVWHNYCISDNLFEYCGSPSHIGDFINIDTSDSWGFLNNYVFENNIVMYSGYGWIQRITTQIVGSSVSKANGGWLAAFQNEFGAANNDGIYFRNNVFYRSSYALLAIRQTLSDGSPVNQDPIFEGNTYVQISTLPLLMRNSGSEFYYPSEDVMQNFIGDDTGRLVILEP